MTAPRRQAEELIGDLRCLSRWITRASIIVAAWGATLAPPNGTKLFVRWSCSDARKPLWCLGVTKHGQPRHPLYVSGAQPLVPFGDD